MSHYFLSQCIINAAQYMCIFASLVLDLRWLDVNYTCNVHSNSVFLFNQPGSIGHSFKDANSAGLFPVSTQFELRSIMGILNNTEQSSSNFTYMYMVQQMC